MKRVLGIVGGVVVLAGLAAAIAVIASAASASTPRPVAYGFDGHQSWAHGQVKPRSVYFGAGGSLFVRRLSWATWNQAGARGRGIRWADSCKPNCATGSYAKSAVIVTLWRVLRHHGQPYFSRMTLAWQASGRAHQQTFRWSADTTISAVPFWR
jgi:hypothetical protein